MKIKKSLLRKLIKESLQKLNEMPYLGYFDPTSPAVANPKKAPVGKFTKGISSEITGPGYIQVAGFIYPFKDEINLNYDDQDQIDDSIDDFESRYNSLGINEDSGLDEQEKVELFLHDDELNYPESAKKALAERRHDYYLTGDLYQPELLSIVWKDLRFSREIYINMRRNTRKAGQPHDSIKGDFAIIGAMIKFYNRMFPREQGEKPFYQPRRKYSESDTATITSDLGLQMQRDAATYRGGKPFIADVRASKYGDEARKALAKAQSASMAGDSIKTQQGKFTREQLVVLRNLSQAHVAGDREAKSRLRSLARQMNISGENIVKASRGQFADARVDYDNMSDTRKFQTDEGDYVTVEDDFDTFTQATFDDDSSLEGDDFADAFQRDQQTVRPQRSTSRKSRKSTSRNKKNTGEPEDPI